jgi:hypothetical protein
MIYLRYLKLLFVKSSKVVYNNLAEPLTTNLQAAKIGDK